MSRRRNPTRSQDCRDVEKQHVPETHGLAQLLNRIGLRVACLGHAVALLNFDSAAAALRIQAPVIAIPVALESLARIILLLQLQKIGKLWIRGGKFVTRRETVVRKIKASAAFVSRANELPANVARLSQRLRLARRMRRKYHARIALLRPRKKRILVRLDETHRSI